MKVERFVTGIISTNCYLAVNEETRQAVVLIRLPVRPIF